MIAGTIYSALGWLKIEIDGLNISKISKFIDSYSDYSNYGYEDTPDTFVISTSFRKRPE